jgi:hypothetical protein
VQSSNVSITVQPNGDLRMIYDTYVGELDAKLGVGLPMLKQGYGVEVTKRQLSRQGYRVTTISNPNGTVSVKAVRA